MELLGMIGQYAQMHPQVRMIVFPHPLERRHYNKTREHQFESLEDIPNVTIDFSEANDSTLQFDRVGLGVTTFSSIGFERMHLGLRTLFYVSDLPNVNWEITSPYNAVFFKEKEAFLLAIEAVRKMSHREFINHYFGALFHSSLDKETLGVDNSSV
jgi:CDP-glycerol glycerophosphotransferase (TagB/SpsB family)